MLVVAAPAVQARKGEIAAIASRSFNDYTRTRLPDNSFKPEMFAFAFGGRLDAPIAGDPIDEVAFKEIIHTLAPALAKRGYFSPANLKPDETDLMVMVFWGTTRGTDGLSSSDGLQTTLSNLNQFSRAQAAVPGGAMGIDGIVSPEQSVANAFRDEYEHSLIQIAAENRWRDKLNEKNAGILGFERNLRQAYMADFLTVSRDVIDEVEENRYFVVLKAYDFKKAHKEKVRRILWETRFSIPQRGNNFSQQLAGMADQASRYFGENTLGLVRRELPEVKVILGEAQVLESKTGQ
jgi:hypothetical protein